MFGRFYLYDLVGLLLLLRLALIVLADASFMSGELAELASRFADRLLRCGSGEQSGWHVEVGEIWITLMTMIRLLNFASKIIVIVILTAHCDHHHLL